MTAVVASANDGLYQAVQFNNTKDALEIIQGPDFILDDFESSNERNWNFLEWASYHGNEKLVDEFLRLGLSTHKRQENTTPLHLAAAKGNLSICWILILSDENSMDAVDMCGNTPLHSAASNGKHEVVSCLLRFGADWTRTNVYKLNALQVAMDNVTRDVLREFAKKGPIFKKERKQMQQKQRDSYTELESSIAAEANESATPRNEDGGIKLQGMIELGENFGLQGNVLDRARERVYWIHVETKLLKLMEKLKVAAPIITHLKLELVNAIQFYQHTVDKEKATETPSHISQMITEANNLCKRSVAEYELHLASKRAEGVICASENDRKTMNLLESLKSVAEEHNGDEEMVSRATKIVAKLNAELDLAKSNSEIPLVRLPVLDMSPKESKKYWEAAKDTGHIQRTDEYPFPPPEGGYIWVKSISFATLERAVVQLEADIQRAKDCLGNAELINNAETRLDKERTHLELLHTKDDNDKVAGVAEAEKAAKKARKKKKNGNPK